MAQYESGTKIKIWPLFKSEIGKTVGNFNKD